MEVRKIDLEKDYSTLEKWWTSYEWPSIPKYLLPPTGYIVDGYSAGFLYKTDSPFCVLEWVVGNKESDRDKRAEALDLVLKSLLAEADDNGYKAIFTSCEHKGLIERYKKFNFIQTDNNMTNLVRLI